uniref:RHD domain-containing protein n=1 Tax=Amphiprion ocellaris TaxID=80972 RepID=A0A3Q1C7C2_AMPOC
MDTANDRYLRPHSFYQVHRVTGKTVTTMCQEKVMGCTKVLEIPLLPENNMAASIDCAGILKLRNADIELKKGETDIGRKNTRVRVVFRVAVPHLDGQMLWLQTVSIPVECSQRSGQDLPQLESFSPNSCSVDGGQELVITGSNIAAQSRVVFVEKGPDGRTLWEMDARVLSEKSSTRIVVEIPPYNKKTTCPVQVQFYVSNGKRRRSVPQCFTYLPEVRGHLPVAAGVKQEHWEPDLISHNAPGFCSPSSDTPSHDQVLSSDVAYYDSCDLPLRYPASHNAPRLYHPPPSSVSFQTLMFPQTSSIPLQSPSMLSQTPLSPHQSLIALNTSIKPPQTFISSQTPVPPQITTIPPQGSSVPLQSFTISPNTSSGGPCRGQSAVSQSSTSTFITAADPQKDSVLSSPGQTLSIKQEPEDQPNLGSLGLQEITLDDGKNLGVSLIHKKVCGLVL